MNTHAIANTYTTSRSSYSQLGGFMGVMMLIAIIIFSSIVTMKIVPAYTEFSKIKSLAKRAQEKGKSITEIKQAFTRQAILDDVTAITAEGLEVTKSGNTFVIAIKYEKRINISDTMFLGILFDWDSTQPD